jgi:hypothetical protein
VATTAHLDGQRSRAFALVLLGRGLDQPTSLALGIVGLLGNEGRQVLGRGDLDPADSAPCRARCASVTGRGAAILAIATLALALAFALALAGTREIRAFDNARQPAPLLRKGLEPFPENLVDGIDLGGMPVVFGVCCSSGVRRERKRERERERERDTAKVIYVQKI